MKIQNQGFDHVEFTVNKIGPHALMYQSMGFEKVGERKDPQKGLRTEVYAQGFIRILLTENDGSPQSQVQEQSRFLSKHHEGVCVLAIDVQDATAAFNETVARGARPAMKPAIFNSSQGKVIRSEIWTPGDIRYAFIERHSQLSGWDHPALFDEGLVVSRLESPSPFNMRTIDHLTNNVNMGEKQIWVDYYEKIMGFKITRHFDIRTGRTGLTSEVVESPCRKIKVPINEATEPESQVQEFSDRFHGAGVQHLALLTTDLISSLKKLKKLDIKFLTVPHTYYETVPTRVPGVTEDLKQLEELQILLDGEKEGYLLQIFTEELVGPFFFEFIQRKGNQGFGEGNFRALFEAIERDQIKRGVLRA